MFRKYACSRPLYEPGETSKRGGSITFFQDRAPSIGLVYSTTGPKRNLTPAWRRSPPLPPKEILVHAYEKVIKEEFRELEQGLDEWETDTLLTCYPAALRPYMRNGWTMIFLLGRIRGTLEKTVAKQAADLRRCVFHVNGEPPAEMKDFYDLHGDELSDTGLEPAGGG